MGRTRRPGSATEASARVGRAQADAARRARSHDRAVGLYPSPRLLAGVRRRQSHARGERRLSALRALRIPGARCHCGGRIDGVDPRERDGRQRSGRRSPGRRRRGGGRGSGGRRVGDGDRVGLRGCGWCRARRRDRAGGRSEGRNGRLRRRDRSRLDRGGRRRIEGQRCRNEGGRRRDACRQERDGIEVSLGVRGDPHAKVHVGLGDLGVAARADCPGAVALGDRRAPGHGERAEVGERHGVAVRGHDRDALAGGRDSSSERHRACGGSDDRGSRITRDVDTAVLARRERMCTVEAERLKDDAADRPRPRACRGRGDQRGENRQQEQKTHRHHLRCLRRERSVTIRTGAQRCQTRLQSCYREPR